MITRQQRDLGLWSCAQWRALPEEAWSFNTWHCGTHGCAIGWLDVWINGGRALKSHRLLVGWVPFTDFASDKLGVTAAEFSRFFVPESRLCLISTGCLGKRRAASEWGAR